MIINSKYGDILIDDCDYDLVKDYNWHCAKSRNTFYAVSVFKNKKIKMHRFILSPKSSEIIDHINGNGLDNRRNNLRIVTASQNRMNCGSYKGTSSIYKGVTYREEYKKWVSGVRFKGVRYNLGTFDNEIAAAVAYDKKSIELFGEFARVNFK